MPRIHLKVKKVLIVLLTISLVLWILSFREDVGKPTYGVSFSRFHSDELELDWKKVYLAMLDDLGVKNFRFSAHWPNTEPEDDKFNFSELDFQMDEARKRNASVILAVGRRLPGWPECHEPEWARAESEKLKTENKKIDFNKEELLEYIEVVVNRYKNYPNLKYWQVENEPFLTFFSRSACGALDKKFLDEEIKFVKNLDPTRQILITDSGEFGNWFQAYRRGDVFGTSLYLYIWNQKIGPFRYPITPAFFRIKRNITELFLGKKPSMIIELEAEPWLLQAIKDAPIDVQFERMGLDKLESMINFAGKTGFDTQYLWGAEWWYWLREKGHPEIWEKAKEIF